MSFFMFNTPIFALEEIGSLTPKESEPSSIDARTMCSCDTCAIRSIHST
jgi:hypothetical protein